MGIGVAMFAVMFIYLIHCFNTGGGMQTHELSMFFTAFVMLQFWNLFNARAYPENEDVFKNLLIQRNEYAKLLGFDSWAAYNAYDKENNASQYNNEIFIFHTYLPCFLSVV